MKKFLSLLLVAGLLVCALCSCGGSPQKDGKDAESKTKVESQTESADRQTSSVQSEAQSQQVQVEPVTPEPKRPEPVYYHAAIKGAVIVEQDGSSGFSYVKRCDSCGYTESNITINTHSTYGEMHSGFTCYKCHTHQEIVIKTTQTN